MASIFWSASPDLLYTPNISAFYITPIKIKKKTLLYNPDVLMSLCDFIPVITDTHTHTHTHTHTDILIHAR